MRPDGALRPSYAALVRHLAVPATTRPARWTARWSTVHPGRLIVRPQCRAADGVCRGRMSASLRAGGLTDRLTKRSYRTSTRHRTATLRIQVSRTVRRRARAASARGLVLRERALRPAAALRKVTLKLARPG
ncbi:MAG TPA: hypothetical protein VGJ70_06895 [Solirubrobacteraceae bacterium]